MYENGLFCRPIDWLDPFTFFTGFGSQRLTRKDPSSLGSPANKFLREEDTLPTQERTTKREECVVCESGLR